ncbi:MAG: serine/threonine-protein kinase [Firmicutes bacterium]|nr:serine/threonine-protein kinase [Bacillota bacterium]
MENSKIIADIYSLNEEIGAGGGGVVYLAEHLRLNKKVVLKADKRTLPTEEITQTGTSQTATARLASLRREVDALKNLRHSNIPQVYDFVVENETVYTVMDFIEGNSLDKLIKTNFHFSQAQMLTIARQLTEALVYLHSRPPHGILHADIKPANVMITPQNETFLIDYNIALALGEDGAIAVGRSHGYASPEHYGVDFGDPKDTVNMYSDSYSTIGTKKIKLTSQSDIYSLGATLYHLVTGEKPPQNATNVVPLEKTTKKCNPTFAKIITKAMQPRKEDRWQTADDMLRAINDIRKNDHRAKRFRKIRAVAATFFAVLFLAGITTTIFGLQQQEQLQTAFLLAEQSSTAQQMGDRQTAVQTALDSLQIRQTPQGQLALTNALNVYDLSDGFLPHLILDLPGNPLFLQISPFSAINTSNIYAAVVHLGNVTVFNAQTGEILANLPTVNSALAEVRFLANDTIIFAGENGLTSYNFATSTTNWQAAELATAIAISADNSTVVSIYRDEPFATVRNAANGDFISQISFGGKHQRVAPNDIFANPQENLLAINSDGSLVAVSFENGELWFYDVAAPINSNQFFDETSGFIHFDGGFYRDYFAFSAISQTDSAFLVLHTPTWEEIGGFQSQNPFFAQADENGIFVQTANILVEIDLSTGNQIPIVTTPYNITAFDITENNAIIAVETPGQGSEIQFFDVSANLISTQTLPATMVQLAENTALTAVFDTPNVRIMLLQNNQQADIFTFDASFWENRQSQARLTSDWQRVIIYAIDQFRLYNINGSLIVDMLIPNTSEIFDQQFRRTVQGDYLEITYRNGTIIAYSAVDGTILFEQTSEQPIDLTLFETFETETLRLESPLHSPPRAYNLATGEFIRELEQDAFLTYVTQTENYVVTQYMRADGHVFGVLLNENAETLAILPYLNDVLPNQNGEYTLIFNYPTGNLRQSRIYNINQLMAMAVSE